MSQHFKINTTLLTIIFSALGAWGSVVWIASSKANDIAVQASDIAAILQPWIDGGHLPVDTNIQLALLVDANRGGTLVVYDAFPHLFKDMSLTHAQMVQNRLLPGGMVP